jgi:predicted lipoprotein with Yx(FWY)xxD motif
MKRRLIVTMVVLAAIVSLAVDLGAALGATQSAGRSAAVATAKSSLGRILVDGQGRTLYLFEKDKHGHSACSGTCAVYWPPALTKGKPIAGRGVNRSMLGVSRRADGTSQVTYAGHPLYRFGLDTKPGQTRGQDLHDFGAGWYVVSPTGKKIEGN